MIMFWIKIKQFKNLRDERKNFEKYIENMEWKTEKGRSLSAGHDFIKAQRLLFRQNLWEDAYIWYKDNLGENNAHDSGVWLSMDISNVALSSASGRY